MKVQTYAVLSNGSAANEESHSAQNSDNVFCNLKGFCILYIQYSRGQILCTLLMVAYLSIAIQAEIFDSNALCLVAQE